MVINALFSSNEDLSLLRTALENDPGGFKCVYLGKKGCLWRLKPEKQFTWPDKPVLFDDLEELFLQAGLKSPLMYLHLSPGLRRVKAQSRKD